MKFSDLKQATAYHSYSNHQDFIVLDDTTLYDDTEQLHHVPGTPFTPVTTRRVSRGVAGVLAVRALYTGFTSTTSLMTNSALNDLLASTDEIKRLATRESQADATQLARSISGLDVSVGLIVSLSSTQPLPQCSTGHTPQQASWAKTFHALHDAGLEPRINRPFENFLVSINDREADALLALRS